MMDVMSILIAMVMGYCMRWWWTIYKAEIASGREDK